MRAWSSRPILINVMPCSAAPHGAKRLVVLLTYELRSQFPADWLDQISDVATIVWRGCETADLDANEFAWAECV